MRSTARNVKYLDWPPYCSLIWWIVCVFISFVGARIPYTWFVCNWNAYTRIWHTFNADWRLNEWSRIYHKRPMHSILCLPANGQAHGSERERGKINLNRKTSRPRSLMYLIYLKKSVFQFSTIFGRNGLI